MRESLATNSIEAANHTRHLEMSREKYLTLLPSERDLDYAASRALIACRDFKAGIKVCHWKGDEDDLFYHFLVTACISVFEIP